MKKRENKIKTINSVSINHICEQNLQHIDAYFTDDEDEEGETIAVVDRDTKKVIFKDNDYINNEIVLKAISDVQKSIEIKVPLVFVELREGVIDRIFSEVDLEVRSLDYNCMDDDDETFIISTENFVDEEFVVNEEKVVVNKDRVTEILDCITKNPSDKLINDVIEEIKINLSHGDETALDELLRFIPKENLKWFLPE